ncbi:MAG: hypothetical protein QE271_01340 [Bacteriovoracaceae bacterium]|nr:hypothetical protein [Bacteriovoracaceae bacterium]
MKYFYIIISLLFFTQNFLTQKLFAQIDTENEYLLILQDYHLPRWSEKVVNGEKQEIRKFLVDAWRKDLVIQYKNLTDPQREMVYEVLSKKAIVNLGYFAELKNSYLAPEERAIFAAAKNQMLNLPPDDRSPYWSFFSNTGSIDGVDVLVSELKQSLGQDKPHVEKSLADLLLISFEGIDTKSYGPPEQKSIFYAPNLDRPYFKKENKELFLKKLNEFDSVVTSIIESKKYVARYPDLHKYYQETGKRISSLKEEKVLVTDSSEKTSNGSATPGRSIASQSNGDGKVSDSTTSERAKRDPAEESNSIKKVESDEPSDDYFKWILVVLFIILIIFSYFFFKKQK